MAELFQKRFPNADFLNQLFILYLDSAILLQMTVTLLSDN